MKNPTTRDFCRKFGACLSGTRFALQYETMRDCYDALLSRKAGDCSQGWAIWTSTCPGVMSARDLRLLAVGYARRVQHLMKDARSVEALDVIERYARGEATDVELKAAQDSTSNARDAAWSTTWDAWYAANAAWSTTWDYAEDALAAAASASALAASYDALGASALAAPYASVVASASDSDLAAAWGAWKAECEAQFKLLAEFGNPFEAGDEK